MRILILILLTAISSFVVAEEVKKQTLTDLDNVSEKWAAEDAKNRAERIEELWSYYDQQRFIVPNKIEGRDLRKSEIERNSHIDLFLYSQKKIEESRAQNARNDPGILLSAMNEVIKLNISLGGEVKATIVEGKQPITPKEKKKITAVLGNGRVIGN